MKLLNWIFSFFMILCYFNFITCWDNTENQMFDLVEEINGTFYEYLGVDGNATSNEIRRAYRKLSLLYHPDKNPNSEDALKFQRLVAIYEILRDDKLRERYNEVLKFGLPDWRQSSFYFRKLRKMSFAESSILFGILATAIHYACLWGAFFEQKWNMEAFLFRRKKRRAEEGKMNEELNRGFKPRWKDILPLAIVKFAYNLVVSTPTNVKNTCDLVKQEITIAIDKKLEKKRQQKAKEEDRKKIDEHKKTIKEKKQILSNENKEKRKIYDTAVQNAKTLPVETFSDLPMNDDIDPKEELSNGQWTSKESVAVIKALSEYPPGVNDRWLKICDLVGMPLREVVKKIGEIQGDCKEERISISTMMHNALNERMNGRNGDQGDIMFAENSDDSESESDDDVSSYMKKKRQRKKLAKKATVEVVPITKQETEVHPLVEVEENDLLENADDSVVHQRKKPRKKTKYLESQEPSEQCSWTAAEQKQLDDAMRIFPKGTSDRWDRISNKIPTKTKTECMERMKTQSSELIHTTVY